MCEGDMVGTDPLHVVVDDGLITTREQRGVLKVRHTVTT